MHLDEDTYLKLLMAKVKEDNADEKDKEEKKRERKERRKAKEGNQPYYQVKVWDRYGDLTLSKVREIEANKKSGTKGGMLVEVRGFLGNDAHFPEDGGRFVYYPEFEDMETFAKSAMTLRHLAPGLDFPGSVGVFSYKYCPEIPEWGRRSNLTVLFNQGSYTVGVHQLLDAKLARHYANWQDHMWDVFFRRLKNRKKVDEAEYTDLPKDRKLDRSQWTGGPLRLLFSSKPKIAAFAKKLAEYNAKTAANIQPRLTEEELEKLKTEGETVQKGIHKITRENGKLNLYTSDSRNVELFTKYAKFHGFEVKRWDYPEERRVHLVARRKVG